MIKSRCTVNGRSLSDLDTMAIRKTLLNGPSFSGTMFLKSCGRKNKQICSFVTSVDGCFTLRELSKI